MNIGQTEYEHTCWGERAVYWLFEQRFMRWPLSDIARATGRSAYTLQAWSQRKCLPGRKELQRLSQEFGHEGFDEFVFGRRNPQALEAKLERITAEIIELRKYLRSPPSRVVSGDDSRGMPVARHQDHRKAVK